MILAILAGEPGAERAFDHLGKSVVSAVNLAEVHGKLLSRGILEEQAWEAALSVAREVVAFGSEQARIAATLAPLTRALGLSLGDRACVALGMALGAPIFTMDRAWGGLRLGVPIEILR